MHLLQSLLSNYRAALLQTYHFQPSNEHMAETHSLCTVDTVMQTQMPERKIKPLRTMLSLV